MFRTMKFSLRYATHLPVLLRAMKLTRGPVLELGAGLFSTPVLHWLCLSAGRELVTMDNDPAFLKWAADYACPSHGLVHVYDWDQANLEQAWDVVLVDHSPDERRIVEIRRLASLAKYLVVHDTNGRYRSRYHYDEIYPLFKHMWTFSDVVPSTTVLSNRVSLEKFWK